MNKIINWVSSLFKDEKGSPSSKRVVGVMCAMALCVTLYYNSFFPSGAAPAKDLIDAISLLAFGCLGLSSVDKFTQRQSKDDN